MKAWLKGGLIGSGLFIVSYIFTRMWCRIQPSDFCWSLFYLVLNYIMQFTGIDYIVFLFTKNVFYPFLIFSLALFFAIGVFIGFLLSKGINWKKKIIVTIIIVILVSPLSYYSHYLKQKDEQIMAVRLMSDRFGAEEWFISDHSVCEELSVFVVDYIREECLSSTPHPKEVEALNIFIKNNLKMQECLKKTDKWVCIQEVATELNDIEICDYHPLSSAQKSCVQQIGIQRNDISLCQKPNESSTSWDEYTYADCIIAIAKKTNNANLCENIEKTNARYDECKFRFVGNTLESCNNLTNYENYAQRFKDDCIIKIAFGQVNLSICELTEHPQKRGECIAKIAMKTRNVGLCKSVTIIRPDECINTIAYLEQDKNICNELNAEWKISRCIDDVGNLIKGRLRLDYIEEYR